MKIVVVSGEDTAKSRSRFVQIVAGVKAKSWEVVPIKLQDDTALAEKLTGTSMFPGEVLYAIDGVKKLTATQLKWLKENLDKYDGSLLIYSDGALPVTIKNALPKSAKFENFEVPKIIFAFLEAFYPGNMKRVLELFEELLKENPVEVLVVMITRQLRDLYWVLDGGKGLTYPPWRMGKLKAQAAKFTKEGLRDTISALAELDIKSKTSDVDAKALLEMLIIEKLG